MKKFVLAFVLLPFLGSCTADNVSRETPPQLAPAKVARQVDFNNGSFVLGYNADRSLKDAVSDIGHYKLTYAGGNISNVTGQMGGEAFNVDFTYSENQKINGITINGVYKEVYYHADKNCYDIVQNPLTQAKLRFYINEDGDLKEYQSFGNQGNFIDGKTYYYEAGQKGPLYNANRVTIQLAMACPKKALYSCTFAGYRPFKHFAGAHAAPMIMENTFDDEGYVVGSEQSEEDFASFAYINI